MQIFQRLNFIPPSEYFQISTNHIIASNESLILFKLYFDNNQFEKEFLEIAKKISAKIEYETLYGDKKLLEKESIAIA